jgi:hypothetical protein
MGKKILQKNSEKLLLQQQTDLEQLRASLPLDTIRAAEDKLLTQCLDIVEGSLDFAALGFTDTGTLDEESIPFAWSQLTPDAKARKIRLAKYACLPSSDVPYGVKAAFEMAMGIIKARSQEKASTINFNLEVSSMPAPAPLHQASIDADYEVIDVE